MPVRTIADRLARYNPCEEGRKWAAGYTDWQTAWNECPNGYWMWWMLEAVKDPGLHRLMQVVYQELYNIDPRDRQQWLANKIHELHPDTPELPE